VRSRKPDFYSVLDDLREECTGNALYLEMIDTLAELYETEERPWFGLVGNLTGRHGKHEARAFLAHLRGLDLGPD
jgi:hypothetical protein